MDHVSPQARISFPVSDIMISLESGTFMPDSPVVTQAGTAFFASLRTVMGVLGRSRIALAHLEVAANRGYAVGLDPLLEPQNSFFYPARQRFDLGYQPHVLAGTEKGVGRYLASTVQALRRIWHYEAGCIPDACLSPEGFMRQIRMMEADVEAVTLLAAWELKSAGSPFFWRQMISGASEDVAQAFAHAAETDPRAIYDGRALKAAFDQWFACDERIAASDHYALEMLDFSLLDPLWGCFVGRGGQEGRFSPAMLGTLPAGTSYLSGYALENAWYNPEPDALNSTHLRHIRADMVLLQGVVPINPFQHGRV